MPYIHPDARRIAEPELAAIIKLLRSQASGNYNYVITRILHAFVRERGLCYETLQSAKGLIAAVADEFQDTVVRPYEDKKRAENGPVDLDGENET